MTDLHAAISAALDLEQACAEAWLQVMPNAASYGGHDPTLPLRRVEADRRVLARHGGDIGWDCCSCAETLPCPDLLDLAARYDVDTSR